MTLYIYINEATIECDIRQLSKGDVKTVYRHGYAHLPNYKTQRWDALISAIAELFAKYPIQSCEIICTNKDDIGAVMDTAVCLWQTHLYCKSTTAHLLKRNQSVQDYVQYLDDTYVRPVYMHKKTRRQKETVAHG